jgi:hypothetical protein
MKKILATAVLLTALFAAQNANGQEFGEGGSILGINLGFKPPQKFSLFNDDNQNMDIYHLNVFFNALYDNDNDIIKFGIVGSLGINIYSTGANEGFYDPYKTTAWRPDINIGASFNILNNGYFWNTFGLSIYPLIGIGYRGIDYTASGPSVFTGMVYLNTSLNADLILFRYLSVGIMYRPIRYSICTSYANEEAYGATYWNIPSGWFLKAGLTFVAE